MCLIYHFLLKFFKLLKTHKLANQIIWYYELEVESFPIFDDDLSKVILTCPSFYIEKLGKI